MKREDAKKINYGDLGILADMLDGLGVENPREAAERLLERFGSFGSIFTATEAELEDAGLTSRAASFFTFVNPALHRAAVGDGVKDAVMCERAAVSCATALLGRRNKLGYYAICLNGGGRRICSEYLGADGAVCAAAIGACRHRTKKLLCVVVKPDGDVGEIDFSRAAELADLVRLLRILDMELIDYLETDGTRFCSLRREIGGRGGAISVFDASDEVYEQIDFLLGVERYAAEKRERKLAAKRGLGGG